MRENTMVLSSFADIGRVEIQKGWERCKILQKDGLKGQGERLQEPIRLICFGEGFKRNKMHNA